MESEKSYVKNCVVTMSKEDYDKGVELFKNTDHGVICMLDGYAIIPIHLYDELRKMAVEYSKPKSNIKLK